MWGFIAAFILGMFAMAGLMFWLVESFGEAGSERLSKEPNWLDDPLPKKRKKKGSDMDEMGVQITKDGMKAGRVRYSKSNPFKYTKKPKSSKKTSPQKS